MAERRRRRRLSEGESGEEVSEDIKDPEKPVRPSECESEDEHHVEEVEVSDYESVTEGKEPGEDVVDNEDDDDDDDEEESEEESDDDSEEESDEESSSEEEDDSDVGVDYADEDGLEEERQSGDGEEQPGDDKDKELDDDEDRRNPAYVPRRGAFYEHDTRITEDSEKEQQRLVPKKKLWKDEGKWQHDRFREDQQAPKSREELMVIYGYDILASDQPPAAAPRINKSRMRNSQQRQQLKDFIDPKWSGRRTSPDVQQKNYRNRRPVRGGGGRSRVGDYGDSRRDYGDVRHEVIESRRDHGDVRHEVIETRRDHGDIRRDYIDNRADSEENKKEQVVDRKWEMTENKRESSEKWHNNQEDSKVEQNEKVVNDHRHVKKEFSENSKEVSEMKKEHYENRRGDYADNRKDHGNNRRDSGDSRRDYADNRREYSDNGSWKNYNDRAHNNGDIKSNNSYRSNQKSAPPRQYTNANYRGDNGENIRTDPENHSSPSYKRSSENNSNYKNNDQPNYRGGGSSEPRGYKGNTHESGHRNHIMDNNRGYRGHHESNSGYSSYRNNDNKQRTPDRNFSNEEVNDSMSKQKGAILNNVEFSGSVVTANNSMEKKSYSKDRRIKGINSRTTRMQPPPLSPHETGIESDRNSYSSESSNQQDGKLDHNSGSSKAENVSRPKRYSTQRQRNLPEVNYPEQIPVDGTTYYSPMSTTGIPSPPRMYGPAPVSLATAPPAMLPPQYIGAGAVIYGAPPPGPYQVPVIPGYQSPPPPTQAPHTQTPGLQEMFRGGTTYYSTDLQQPSPSRSPVRRQKSAIPIINPQDVKNPKSTSANDTDSANCQNHEKSDQMESCPKTTDHAVESGDCVAAAAATAPSPTAESSDSPKQTVSETPTTAWAAAVAATAVVVNPSSSSMSKSESACAVVISKEKSPSEDDIAAGGDSSPSISAAHKTVPDLAESCAPSEQATQPILEAAA